jgi:hypothetical protein
MVMARELYALLTTQPFRLPTEPVATATYEDTANTTATQMAALTYQSQLTAATAANASERMDQYVHTLAQQQEQLQQMQHQLMVQLAALTLNHGKGQGVGQQLSWECRRHVGDMSAT